MISRIKKRLLIDGDIIKENDEIYTEVNGYPCWICIEKGNPIIDMLYDNIYFGEMRRII